MLTVMRHGDKPKRLTVLVDTKNWTDDDTKRAAAALGAAFDDDACAEYGNTHTHFARPGSVAGDDTHGG